MADDDPRRKSDLADALTVRTLMRVAASPTTASSGVVTLLRAQGR